MKILEYQHMPTIAILMQPFPYFVDPNTSVGQIRKLMQSQNIRHIPIQQQENVVGIVYERDLLKIGNSPESPSVNAAIPVRNIMTLDPYMVEIDTPITTVIFAITQRKIGAAIILSSGKLVGIVTVTDICRAFGELLDFKYKLCSYSAVNHR